MEKSLNSEYPGASRLGDSAGISELQVQILWYFVELKTSDLISSIQGKCFNQFPAADTVCIWEKLNIVQVNK